MIATSRQAVRAARHWHHFIVCLVLCVFGLSACGGNDSSDNGTDLGSGHLLAFIGNNGQLWLARGDGSMAHAASTTACPSTTGCYGAPSWSLDGQHVAVFGPTSAANASGNVIYIYNRRGLLEKTLMPLDSQAGGSLLWSTDGKTIAYQGRSQAQNGTIPPLAIILIDVASGKQSSAVTIPHPTGSDVTCAINTNEGALGSYIDRAINGSNGFRSTLAWSHDNQRFLVDSGQCFSSISLVQRANSSAQTIGDSRVAQAAFSPDGQQIVGVQSNDTGAALIVYDSTGTNSHTLLSDTSDPLAFAQRISSPTWSADGKQIFFMRDVDLWVINSDGSNPQKLVSGNSTGDLLKAIADPQPSPDGQHLTWVELSYSNTDKILRSSLIIGTIMAQQPQNVASDALWPAWS